MNYDLLFEAVQIGPVTAPNRFYAVPHATGHGNLQPNGSIALRETKAEGGWGTVVMQITEIAASSDMANHPMERLWDETYLDAHAKLVERIKRHGALSGIELAHCGMRARNYVSGIPVIGPSNLPLLRPEFPIQVRAMNKSDIRDFRDSHRKAAQLAKRAGYDILYVYAAHDLSLLSNFLSARNNQRSDEYGGSLKNRVRLLREVLEDTLEVASGSCAVALRFSVHEFGFEQAMTYDGEAREVVEMLAELPDLWDVNIAGWPADSQTSRFSEEGYQLEFTDFVKSVTTKPVVGVGRFTSPEKMISLIRSGRLDLIGAARPSIADPFLPTKIREGRLNEIRECIGCNICVSCDAYGVPVKCTQNPSVSEEWRRGWHPENIPSVKKQQTGLIVGGGPAGLECAWTLVRAGMHVTMVEAEEEFGGRVSRESRLSGLFAWSRVRDYRLMQLQQHENVELFPANRLNADDIEEFDADNVVIATGASWRGDGVGSMNYRPLPWLNEMIVLTPDDVMSNVAPSGPVIVYDDDHFYMGAVLAEHLHRMGNEVRFITPHQEISAWTAFTLEQGAIMNRFADLGIPYHSNLMVKGKQGKELVFTSMLPGMEDRAFSCETLVFVGARLARDELQFEVRKRLGENKVYAVGDCDVPGTIQAAVFSGHRVARQIIDGDESFFRLDRPDIVNR
ncbi:MAG: FAD-dependent oxidoreductase [Arenicellales bacterium]|jgi:dimethylamine/trimethylamine dehydrogenase|nr:FAD-dependent oxidoreductase [Arenicellales bacterium]|tara:strand:+ start:3442 stop:5478 length:2037 start_codon:yes stop_codon:yes gene_type:complete